MHTSLPISLRNNRKLWAKFPWYRPPPSFLPLPLLLVSLAQPHPERKQECEEGICRDTNAEELSTSVLGPPPSPEWPWTTSALPT